MRALTMVWKNHRLYVFKYDCAKYEYVRSDSVPLFKNSTVIKYDNFWPVYDPCIDLNQF